jgi:biotin carboxyl carrier protein
MKSYWITATVVLLTAWPSSSKAYVAGLDQSLGQSKAEETQAQAAQTSAPSSPVQAAAAAQEPSATVKPALIDEPATAPPATAAPKPKDSYMLVELSGSLNTKKLKAGDRVKAEVSQDVISHGKIIIPVETQLVGHVTEVSVRDAANPESRLGIVFDRIVLKHYHDIDFQAVVQAVAPPVERRSRVDEPSQMLPPSMMGGGPRGSSMGPVSGGSSSSSGRGATSSPVVSASQPSGDVPTVFQTGLTVKESPAATAAGGASAVQVKAGTGGGKPMSVGMPLGVTGLKGLSLSTTPTASTPGPVIVSGTTNVKLESGTQILLHVMSVEAQK